MLLAIIGISWSYDITNQGVLSENIHTRFTHLTVHLWFNISHAIRYMLRYMFYLFYFDFSQILVAKMKNDPQNADLQKQLHHLQAEITTLSERQVSK